MPIDVSASSCRYHALKVVVVTVVAVALLSPTAMRRSSMLFAIALRRGVINRPTMLASSFTSKMQNWRRPSSFIMLHHPCILPPTAAATNIDSHCRQRHHGSLLVHSLRPHDNDDITDDDDDTTTTKKTIMNQLSQQLHANESTIKEVLHVSLHILSEGSSSNNTIIIHEPIESVLHLLSHALELRWEDNGFCQLREVLLIPPTPPPSYSSSCSSNIQNLASQTLTIKQYTNYLSYIHRRLHHEPIQYILEKWDFYNLIGLKVSKPILCPRPETEELVELVLDDIDQLIHDMNIDHEEIIEQQQQQQKQHQQQQQSKSSRSSRRRIRVLDVGCGTGAIGIAIAYAYPQYVQVVAIDISSEAIKLSNENANYFLSSFRRANENEEDDGGGCCLYNAILCSAKDFTNNKTNEEEEEASISSFGTMQLWEMDFDIIVSNPPYIPMKDMTLLTKDVINYESHNALCGGYDGLDVVRDILHRLQEWTSSPTIIADYAVVAEADTNKHSSKRTTPRYCWMEVDDTHPILLEEWLSPGSIESIRHGVEYCDRRKDCYGRDRFVKFRVL